MFLDDPCYLHFNIGNLTSQKANMAKHGFEHELMVGFKSTRKGLHGFRFLYSQSLVMIKVSTNLPR